MSNRRSIVKRGKIRRSRSLEQEARLLLWVRTQTGRIMGCIERGEHASWSSMFLTAEEKPQGARHDAA